MSSSPRAEEIATAVEEFELLRNRVNAARIAYLRRTPLDGREVTYDDLRRFAEGAIEANYRLQRLRYGRVRVRLSVSKMLRRGR